LPMMCMNPPCMNIDVTKVTSVSGPGSSAMRAGTTPQV